MSYPTLEQYNEALQNHRNSLVDPELKAGTIAKSGLGLPLALCGGFALTYTITTGAKKYAVRCFHKQSSKIESRYGAISIRLRDLRSPYFVDFDFQPQGIHIAGKYYPIVKMAWASGKTLGEYLPRADNDRSGLQRLNLSLRALAAYLDRAGIAHGDIQPGNVMVAATGRTVQLIDYDGMYVQDLQGLGSAEQGLRNFQHPERTASPWDPRLDRFSFIELDLALRALEADPSLWTRTKSDETGIIFKANDFVEPGQSGVFQELMGSNQFSEDARNFAAICKAPYGKTPTLEDFLAGRHIPKVLLTISPRPVSAPIYLGAYPILDATDYALCQRHVGDLVEVVGQIIDISARTTHHGKPYVFLNFGNWRGDIFKVNIWSEGLEALPQAPDETWVGRWVSVIGLMEPPYFNPRYDYTHLSITITRPSELTTISEDEARFRLAGSSPQASASVATPQAANRKILDEIKGVSRPAPTAAWPVGKPPIAAKPARAATPPPSSPNQQVLRQMKATQRSAAQISPAPARSRGTPKSARRRTRNLPILLAVSILGTILICLLVLSILSQSPRPTAPIPRTVPSAMAPAPSVKPTQTKTPAPACIFWRDVVRSSRGQIQCVFGEVDSRRTFTEGGAFSYFLLRFSNSPQDLYVTSHKAPLNVSPGQCVSARSEISMDPNGVFFLEVSEVSSYRCP